MKKMKKRYYYYDPIKSLEEYPIAFDVDDYLAADWIKRQAKKTGKTPEQIVTEARAKEVPCDQTKANQPG
jgi:hypothetical protein